MAYLKKDLGLEPEAVHALLKAHPSLLLEGPAAALSALCTALELDAALVTVGACMRPEPSRAEQLTAVRAACIIQTVVHCSSPHHPATQWRCACCIPEGDACSMQTESINVCRRWRVATRASWRCRRSMQRACCAASGQQGCSLRSCTRCCGSTPASSAESEPLHAHAWSRNTHAVNLVARFGRHTPVDSCCDMHPPLTHAATVVSFVSWPACMHPIV